MSSGPLPRALQPKRSTTSLDQDRESFEKSQAVALSKAINQNEVPVKEKHVRSAIIGTFQAKGAHAFWANVNRLPLNGNPIVCWKACHTLHKILREGHPSVLEDSQRYKPTLTDLGKLWGHLKEGYGKLIQVYTSLLRTKLEFHAKNPRIPGNLLLPENGLERICENDINNYFQLAVEMLDYMDDILALQAAVLGSLDMSRSNSMTNAGQCRLAPLIPCIQDSSLLYDYTVKLLFKLHSCLPPDILAGHRARFLKQFGQLKQFYIISNTLQYFKHLIQVPLLPENPPNFLIASELSSHVTPVVILPPEEEETIVSNEGMLIDIQASAADQGQRNGSVSPDLLAERDRYIEHLLHQIEQLSAELHRLKIENQRNVGELQQRILELELLYGEKNEELQAEARAREELLVKLGSSSQKAEAQTLALLQDSEKKAKQFEEKFTKLKDVYQKLREEHIQLIRQKAEVDKQVTVVKITLDDAQKTKKALEARLEETQSRQEHLEKEEETLRRVTAEKEALTEKERDLRTTVAALGSQITQLETSLGALRTENQVLTDKLSDESSKVSTRQQQLAQEEEKLTILSKQNEVLVEKQSILQETAESLERQMLEKEKSLVELRSDHQNLRQKLEEESCKVFTNQQQLEEEIKKYQLVVIEREALAEKQSTLQKSVGRLEAQITQLEASLATLSQENQSLKQKCDEEIARGVGYKQAYEKALQEENRWFQEALNQAQKFLTAKVADLAVMPAVVVSTTPESLASVIDSTLKALDNLGTNWTDNLKQLMLNTYELTHNAGEVLTQGRTIASCFPDIEKADRLLDQCKGVGKDGLALLAQLRSHRNYEELSPYCNLLCQSLTLLRDTSVAMGENLKTSASDLVGEVLEDELATMDKAIEEAARRIEEMLSRSREADTGVKLEVNEKVLDSCTALMKAIRVLIQRSRNLQEEVVAQKKGSASAKEFYKRNHRWTEGLISAAKAVGFGAKLLMEAADKVVQGQGKFEQLMVASQEIAGSTAQLVYASRVKATPNSNNLSQLEVASKGVSEATGGVVATAKLCAQMVEDITVMDFSQLSLHQAKRFEMESQVKVLELESSLNKERVKLASLRKQHYRLAGEAEGWEQES